MKSTPITAVVLSLALSAFTTFAAVTVTNVTTAVAAGAFVTISYDLASASALTNAVGVSISTNAGATFFSTCTNFTGAVGNNVAAGTAKQIVWDAWYDTLPIGVYSNTRVRVWASDSMALIPAGAFQMGTNNLPYESQMTAAGPNHTVTLSAFYMDKYEVTSQQWFAVRNWALANGYTFDNTGSGKAANHPVQTVNWYDCIKWCNARSEKEGLTPCYYTNAAQTLVYRGGSANLSNEWVKWTANGYRLPTEAEWEKAARGGAAGMRFPWSDGQTISRAQANYYGYTSYAYDLGPNGCNPLFTPGGTPYTSPVGYFTPNGYGLYDMAGNVLEWCWDWYGSTYYATSPSSNPTGPATGTYRVLRGGIWNDYAYGCRVAFRGGNTPDYASGGFGFRCVRGL